MVEIRRSETELGYWFEISIDNDIFKIYFMGNLDLFWKYQYKGDIRNIEDSKSFFITKENYFLFKLFDKLYNDIKNCDIYNAEACFNKDMFQEIRQYPIDTNSYSYNLLFHDDKIEWRSDDCLYEEASSFTVEAIGEFYKLTFKRGMVDNFFTYNVRIRNSGSRYVPFNIPFMDMYYKLCEYQPDYHQIHIEEYLYQKKRGKKKETI